MILIRRGKKIPPDFFQFTINNLQLTIDIDYQSNYELNFRLKTLDLKNSTFNSIETHQCLLIFNGVMCHISTIIFNIARR